MNINLQIERLVLDGVNIPPGQRHLLQTSIETELARLLMQGGVSPNLAAGGAFAQVSTTDLTLAAGNGPVRLGRQIAQSVYGGVGK